MKRLLFLVILPLALLSGCGEPVQQVPGSLGSPAPAYGAPTTNGDSLDIAGLKGTVVLLNIWATWCIPCRREIPELQALHQQFEGEGLRVLGVSVDGGEADEDVRAFARDFGMTYPILRDPGDRVSNVFRIQGVPASYLIDRNGIVQWRTLGPFKADDAALQTALKKALIKST